MRDQDVGTYRHPRTGVPLQLGKTDSGEPALTGGGDTFPVVRGIPRFVPATTYADNFGYQWQVFERTQLDSHGSWAGRSETRFFEETRWPRDLTGQRVLEAGSGMGRFTEVLARTGADVYTFDYSSAIDANARNNASFENVSFSQADIYHPPFAPESFDRVLCFGVIQHCPDPRGAFRSLVRMLKPGGSIVVDVYRLFWKSLFMGKYYLRPVTSRLPVDWQHPFVRAHMAWTYPLTGAFHRFLGLRAGRYASMALSIADFRGLPDISDEAARELSELDTLDMLAPRYDYPQTLSTVRKWMLAEGLVDVDVTPGYNGVEARATKPRA